MKRKEECSDLTGAHMPISGGVHKSIEYGDSVDAGAIQIFIKNARSWKVSPFDEDEVKNFKEALKNSSCVRKVVVHCTYLINLASSKKEVREKSKLALLGELQRAEQLGIHNYVLHPGAHLGDGVKAGIKRIVQGIKFVLSHTDSIKITLENMAGQGTVIGSKLEELADIIDGVGNEKRLAVCLDTCHAHAAGYVLKSPEDLDSLLDKAHKLFGLRMLEVVHVNDSIGKGDSHLDRHANIGKGTIPIAVFKHLMKVKHLKKIPKILETPAEELSDYAGEIALLRSFE